MGHFPESMSWWSWSWSSSSCSCILHSEMIDSPFLQRCHDEFNTTRLELVQSMLQSRCTSEAIQSPRISQDVPGLFTIGLWFVGWFRNSLFESWLKYIFEMVFIVFEALLPTGLNFHCHVLTSKHAIFGDKTMVFIMGHLWVTRLGFTIYMGWRSRFFRAPPPGRGRASLLAVRWDKRLMGLEAANCGDSTTIAGGWFNQEKIWFTLQ